MYTHERKHTHLSTDTNVCSYTHLSTHTYVCTHKNTHTRVCLPSTRTTPTSTLDYFLFHPPVPPVGRPSTGPSRVTTVLPYGPRRSPRPRPRRPTPLTPGRHTPRPLVGGTYREELVSPRSRVPPCTPRALSGVTQGSKGFHRGFVQPLSVSRPRSSKFRDRSTWGR